jgi:hypothetical protein
MGMLCNEDGLYDSFRSLNGNKAPGIDGVKKEGSSRFSVGEFIGKST